MIDLKRQPPELAVQSQSNKLLWIGSTGALLIAIACIAKIASAAGTTTAAHAPVVAHATVAPVPHPVAHAAISLNSHLHTAHTTVAPHVAPATPATVAATPHAATPHANHAHALVEALTHRGWHYRWSYHNYISGHKGVGAVAGYVVDASGRPIPNARVVLKTPKGKIFKDVAKRHITHTNGYGAFVMQGVRAANYRVVAVKGKQRAHVISAVQTGGLTPVEIRI